MRIACVTASWNGSWNERALVARRVASALSFAGEVDVLCADGVPEPRVERRGALTIRAFPATAANGVRRQTLLHAILGFDGTQSQSCSCDTLPEPDVARETPWILQEELLRASGGDSPTLFEHLTGSSYDCVVFLDCQAPSTVLGVRALPAGRRVVLLPMARNDPTFELPIFSGAFERAERVLVTTETERGLVAGRVTDASRLRHIGFALQTEVLATATEPPGFDGRRFVVVVGDWTSEAARDELAAAVAAVREVGIDVVFQAFGPGSEALEGIPHVRLATMRTRLDLWRWMCRALAVVDWERSRFLGWDVLESMLNGVPIVVHELAGAAREHAERSNGGVWFRTQAELAACIRALSDESLRRRLGMQGRAYATERYGDPDSFIAAVAGALGP